jgi:hypothetical protein
MDEVLNKSNIYDNEKSVFSSKIVPKLNNSNKKSVSLKYSSNDNSFR